MDTYIIKDNYPDGLNTCDEVSIESKNLIYSQIGYNLHGLQCNHTDEKHSLILEKCSQVAKLMREIDELNKKDKQI